MLGERRREAEDAAAALSVETVDSLPFAFRIKAIVLRERFVHEGVIRIEQREDAAVVLNEVDEEAGDFLLHVVAEIEEGGEVAFALFIERGDIAHMQPLAAELGGEAAHFVALHHALGLSEGQDRRSLRCGGAEFVIGRGGPEEVAEACRELLRAHRAGFFRSFLAAIQKRGADVSNWRTSMRQTRIEV